MNKFLVLGFVTLVLVGCQSGPVGPVEPQVMVPRVGGQAVVQPGAPVSGIEIVDTSVVALERSLTLLERAALIYTTLPRCDVPPVMRICSERNIVKQIRDYAIVAHEAVVAARNNQALIGYASQAVRAFASVVPR